MKKRLLVVLVALFAFLPLVSAEELNANGVVKSTINYDLAEIKESQDTTEGVTLEDDYEGSYDLIAYLTYTITDEVDLESTNGVLVLNFIKDIYASNYVQYSRYIGLLPSSKIEIHLTIINNTQHDFELKEGDLIISTVSYKDINKSNGKKVETFDGNELDVTSKYNINRCTNEMLKKLLGKSFLVDDDVTDEKVSSALKLIKDDDGTLKYPNGVDDLDKYYVDYYNEKNNKNYTSIFDFSIEEIDYMFGSKSGANHTSVLESNSNLAKLGYDYFYNRIVTVIPEGETDKYNQKYSIGEYMRDIAPDTLEEQVRDCVENMDSKDEAIITSYIYGDTGNSYQGYSFGLNISAKITAKKYKVVAKYIDEDGKTLTDDVVEEYFNGKEYKTEEKAFEGYELIKVLGEKTGTINKSDVEVIYVYQFVMGEGGEEFDIVQTGSEVDYSLMSSALITLSLIGLALYTKKKKN
ncbi:MAG: MucBP domain-containing protein [Bacilli bacterium]|nr:MucBP domain-containing protein [Bacilli bacterium]